jgi:nucleolin
MEEEKEEASAPAPAAAEDGATAKCYVGNLSWSIDEAAIKEFFKDCGTITDVHWLEDKESGKFLGKGFITFENVEQARKAYALKDQECMGRPIQVDYARPREGGGGGSRGGGGDRPLSEKPEGCTTVFLGNLSFDIDDDAVKAFAKDCGNITSIRWLTHRDTGDFKGCGFAEFDSTEAVDKFVLLNGQKLMGRPIRIDYAQSKSSGGRGGRGGGTREMSEKPENCTTVFIGNVSFDIEDSHIHEIAGADKVKSIRWLTDRETKEFKGCGFVEFYDTAGVDEFVKHNGKDILGRSIRVDYAKPRPPRE